MHSGFLPGLLLSLAGGVFGTVGAAGASSPAQPANSPQPNLPALYSIVAQAGTTATVTITATGTVGTSGTVVAGTPALTSTVVTTATTTGAVPLPTAAPSGGGVRLNPLDWEFLTSAPTDPNKIGPFGWLGLVLMLALLAGGIYFLVVKRPEWKKTNSVYYRAVNRFAQPAIWLGVIGLLLLLFRQISLDFFNLRFWLYLWFLALLGVVGWFVYWYRVQYPKEMAKYQKTQKARQYMPGAKPAIRTGSRPSGPAGGTTPAKPAPKPGSGSGSGKQGKRK